MNIIQFITSNQSMESRGLRIKNLFNAYAIASSKEDKIIIRKALTLEVQELAENFSPCSFEKFFLMDMIESQRFSKKMLDRLCNMVETNVKNTSPEVSFLDLETLIGELFKGRSGI